MSAVTGSNFLDLSHGRHHIVSGGRRGPVVVFEPAIGDVAETWASVLPGVAEFARVFTHDRPGLGHSDPADQPRTSASMVDEMRAALAGFGVAPPYILVGHSFASLTVRLSALLHPREVSGLVLVDGAHEDQMERFPPELNPRPMLAAFVEQLGQAAATAERGEVVPELAPDPAGFKPDQLARYRSATSPTPTRLRTMAAEYEMLDESAAQVRRAASRGLGKIPLIALRHGLPQPMPGVADEVNDRYEATWQDLQLELAGSTARGEVEAVEGAGHMIHHDRPEAVVAAIRRIARTVDEA